MPLMIWMVKGTFVVPETIVASLVLPEFIGNMVIRFLAPAAAMMLKLNLLLLQVSPLIIELFLPSSQVSICLAETTGTPWACAEAMIASEPGDAAWSVCMLAQNTP